MYVMRNCFLTTEVGVVGMYLLAESISHDTGLVEAAEDDIIDVTVSRLTSKTQRT
jgi:hypothetical protein